MVHWLGHGGLVREIKIPVQELKTLGGLIREGGLICGTLRYANSDKNKYVV